MDNSPIGNANVIIMLIRVTYLVIRVVENYKYVCSVFPLLQVLLLYFFFVTDLRLIKFNIIKKYIYFT